MAFRIRKLVHRKLLGRVLGTILSSAASIGATGGTFLVVASVADAQVSRETGALVVNSPVFVLPDATRRPLIVLEAGTPLKILETTNDWYRVEFVDRQFGPRVGYVRASNVRVTPRSSPPVPEPGARSAAETLAQARTGSLMNEAVGPSSLRTNERFQDLRNELRTWDRSFFEVIDDPQRADVMISLMVRGEFFTLVVRQRVTGTILLTASEGGTSKDTMIRLAARMTQEIDTARLPATIPQIDPQASRADQCKSLAALLEKQPGRTLAKKIRAANFVRSMQGADDRYVEAVFVSAFPCLKK